MIFTKDLYPYVINKGSSKIGKIYIGKDLVFNYINDPYAKYKLIMYLSGEDAPVSNNWVCRITGKRWTLYGGAAHDPVNKYYKFESSSQYAQLADSVYNFGNHWVCVVDGEFKLVSNNYGLCVDFGSITSATKATSVQYGHADGNVASQNWKLFGNGSNPGAKIQSDLFTPLSTTEWKNITMHQKITDSGKGFDVFSAKINDSPWVNCENKIPQTDYNGMNIPWKINQGVAGSSYAGLGRFRSIKVYTID